MMHGKLNTELLCRVIERILSERDGSEVKVTLLPKIEKEENEKYLSGKCEVKQ